MPRAGAVPQMGVTYVITRRFTCEHSFALLDGNLLYTVIMPLVVPAANEDFLLGQVIDKTNNKVASIRKQIDE